MLRMHEHRAQLHASRTRCCGRNNSECGQFEREVDSICRSARSRRTDPAAGQIDLDVTPFLKVQSAQKNLAVINSLPAAGPEIRAVREIQDERIELRAAAIAFDPEADAVWISGQCPICFIVDDRIAA